jgi:uncharacterized protein
MYSRLLTPQNDKSFFLFGPRGTGKSSWVTATFPGRTYIDLLEADRFTDLLARPSRLEEMIPRQGAEWIIIDEVQKIPPLLDEVHRLIESRGLRFVLTGSSARKLKAKGVNLLAGRALTYFMHPLTTIEVGGDFSLAQALERGQLPATYREADPHHFLESYVMTYLKEEVQQEGLTRNLGNFSRFLEAASFSQAAPLTIQRVASDCHVDRKVVEHYFGILEDLLLGWRLPVFTRRAKRRMTAHPKFFFFDVGVFRTIRPTGPLDSPAEIDGAAIETLFVQEVRAINDYYRLGYTLSYWRDANQREVDLVLYGPRGLKAFELKRRRQIDRSDLRGLKAFCGDYPEAEAFCIYGGPRRETIDGISILPLEETLRSLTQLL